MKNNLKKYAALSYSQRNHTFQLKNFAYFLIPVVFTAMIFFSLSINKATDSPTIDLHKYYTSIEVQNGDSLWSIAEEYISPEYKSTQEYIKEVMQLNHLTSYEIHVGGSLVVPYYRSDR